jgi:hypothetical protein
MTTGSSADRTVKFSSVIVTVVISHDQAAIDQLTSRGVLHDGFDLKNK